MTWGRRYDSPGLRKRRDCWASRWCRLHQRVGVSAQCAALLERDRGAAAVWGDPRRCLPTVRAGSGCDTFCDRHLHTRTRTRASWRLGGPEGRRSWLGGRRRLASSGQAARPDGQRARCARALQLACGLVRQRWPRATAARLVQCMLPTPPPLLQPLGPAAVRYCSAAAASLIAGAALRQRGARHRVLLVVCTSPSMKHARVFLNHYSSTTSEPTLEHIKPPRHGRLNPRIISVGGEEAPSFPSCRRRVASAPDQARLLVRSARVALRELAAVHAVPVPLQQHARPPRNHHCLPGLAVGLSMPAARAGGAGAHDQAPAQVQAQTHAHQPSATLAAVSPALARRSSRTRPQTPPPAPGRLPPCSARPCPVATARRRQVSARSAPSSTALSAR